MPLRPELSEDGDPAQRHGQSPSWKSRPGAQNNGRPQGAREGRVTDVHPTFLGEKFWAVSFFLFFQFRARGWEQSSSEEQERALEAGPAWQTGTPCEASALGPLSQACPWLCPRELAEAPDACAAEGACRGAGFVLSAQSSTVGGVPGVAEDRHRHLSLCKDQNDGGGQGERALMRDEGLQPRREVPGHQVPMR